jgi:hypothetical protein
MFAKTFFRLVLASLAIETFAPAAEAPAVGPPLICHPIDIGKAESLPFGEGAFEMAPDFPLERVTSEAVRILEGSDDVLVHMETIRRAVIYLAESERGSGKSARSARVGEFLAALSQRVEGIGTLEANRASLRFFDRGYAVAAFRQLNADAEGDPVRDLREAIARRSEDPALRFGVALATFDVRERGKDRICFENLEKALAGATDPKGLLRKNLVGTIGKFLDADSYEALVRTTRERLARL